MTAMTTESKWPDPARPGVPLNPERGGAHVLRDKRSGREKTEWWGGPEKAAFGGWDSFTVKRASWDYDYVGPCLTPTEHAAAVAQARAEGVDMAARLLREQGWTVEPPEPPAQPGNITEADLRAMMRDPRYWRTREPAWVKKVTDGFRELFGNG